jgi:polyferredoxin
MLVLPVYAFITFYRRVKRGVLKKSRALWRYASLVITPIILYVLFFLALVGFEELTHISVITEGLARTILILVELGLTIWLVSILLFGVALVFIKSQPSSPNKAAAPDRRGRAA